MFRILAHLAATVLTVLVLHEILPDEIYYESTGTLIIFALVLGLFSAVVLPVLQIIALPLTCLTLGLFAFVLSAAVFYVSGLLVPGIEITILGAAIGAILLGVLSGVLDTALRPRY
jgi:putative membrane protein